VVCSTSESVSSDLSGALHARFHFPVPGRLFVSCEQESEFVEFAKKEVAGRAMMFIRSEPARLDRLIAARILCRCRRGGVP
jgi:hypothetical protein